MALKAGYVGVKKNDATKLSKLPGITEIGTGLDLEDGELSATGATKTIEGNPEGSATETLTKLQIGDDIFSIPGNDNTKCYQTDDATESAIVDADYIPFFDASAASGAGAPRKSTWTNFISKIQAKLTDFVTWSVNAETGVHNYNDDVSTYTFVKSTARTNRFHIDRDLNVGDKISIVFNISDVSGFVTSSNKFGVRIGSSPTLTADIYPDITQSKVRLEYTITAASLKSSDNNAVYMFIGNSEDDSATITISNLMVLLASDTDDTYAPFAMTNRELTIKRIQYIDVPVKNVAITSQSQEIGCYYGSKTVDGMPSGYYPVGWCWAVSSYWEAVNVVLIKDTVDTRLTLGFFNNQSYTIRNNDNLVIRVFYYVP